MRLNLDPKSRRFVAPKIALLVLASAAAPVLAQQSFQPSFSIGSSSADDLSDVPGGTIEPAAPAGGPQQPAADANAPVQTKRILGIVPNFRSVSADTRLPPQTAREKFVIAGRDTFDYSSFFIAAVQAGLAMNSASYPEFHQGIKGYTRYYWHTLADTIDENFMVGGLGPAVFHQDNRFYTLGHGSFLHRAGYAVTRVVITRKDDGDPTPNFSEVLGAGASSGLSSLYYPGPYRTWTKVGQKWLTSILIDGANFTVKEFWPDINKKAFHTHD